MGFTERKLDLDLARIRMEELMLAYSRGRIKKAEVVASLADDTYQAVVRHLNVAEADLAMTYARRYGVEYLTTDSQTALSRVHMIQTGRGLSTGVASSCLAVALVSESGIGAAHYNSLTPRLARRHWSAVLEGFKRGGELSDDLLAMEASLTQDDLEGNAEKVLAAARAQYKTLVVPKDERMRVLVHGYSFPPNLNLKHLKPDMSAKIERMVTSTVRGWGSVAATDIRIGTHGSFLCGFGYPEPVFVRP